MTLTTAVAVAVLILALAWSIHVERRRHAALGFYWARGCAGRAWRTAFPNATRHDIREFLYLVVDAFGFDRTRALQLQPTDSVQGFYRACYPDPTAPDAMELETLERSLLKRYGPERFASLPEGVTFGALFARVGPERPNSR
jgi:propanediol dehydratase small subunit